MLNIVVQDISEIREVMGYYYWNTFVCFIRVELRIIASLENG